MRLLSLFLALCCCAGAALAQGVSVSIGGALRPGNSAVWQRVVQLAGGPGARFVVLATASGDPDRSAASIIESLRAHGAVAEHIRVAPRIAGIDLAAAVRDPVWLAKVAQAQGVFFAGGEQARLLDTLQPAGQPTPLLQALRGVWARGGVIAGTSAGAAVMSEVVFRDLGHVLSAMKAPLRQGIEIDRGFGFVPHDVIVDQHFLRRGRIGRLLPLLLQAGVPLGLGVEEDSAAIVRGDEVEAIGARGVLVIDTHSASSDPAAGAFNVSGVRLSYLDQGDRFNLKTRRLTPSPRKLAGPVIDPNASAHRGYFQGRITSADMLGPGTIVELMSRLVDSDQRQALGLAFDAWPAADDTRPDLGFEWRLSIGPMTRAWPGASGDDTSIAEMLLDVRPLRLAQPMHRPYLTVDPTVPKP